MNTYKVIVSARKVGALGVWSIYTREVEAESEKEAILKLYDELEHISVRSIELKVA